MADMETASWSLSSVLGEYGAGLLVLGLALFFVYRNFLPAQSVSSQETVDVSADEQRRKRLEELQRRYNEQSLAEQEKLREKEAAKLNEKEEQFRRIQGQVQSNDSGSKAGSDKNRLRSNDYNPLMGQSSGSGGYRAQKRKPPGGGCCGGGGGGCG